MGSLTRGRKETDMEYTKFMGYKWCDIVGEEVGILKYESKDNAPYCECSRCGKPIKRVMYVVQSKETDLEHFYLGAECIKKIF